MPWTGKVTARGRGGRGGGGCPARARSAAGASTCRSAPGFVFRARVPLPGDPVTTPGRAAGGGCRCGALQPALPQGAAPSPPHPEGGFCPDAVLGRRRGDKWQRLALPPPPTCSATVTPPHHRDVQELGPGKGEAETPAPT